MQGRLLSMYACTVKEHCVIYVLSGLQSGTTTLVTTVESERTDLSLRARISSKYRFLWPLGTAVLHDLRIDSNPMLQLSDVHPVNITAW